MAAALVETRDRGGVLARRSGGYWTPPGSPYRGAKGGLPYDWWIPSSTVLALIKRGLFEVTQSGERWGGHKFPLEVRLAEEVASARLAQPLAVAHDQTETARNRGDHKAQEGE